MLATTSVVLATLVSILVIAWIPRPPPPAMRLQEAVQVQRGQVSAAAVGLRVSLRATPPQGTRSDWLSRLAAQQLGRPPAQVRLVWVGGGKVPEVQVIEGGTVLDGGGRDRVLKEQGALLAAMQWPLFELGVQQPDGRWQVVGSDYSGLSAWRRQALLALLGGMVLLAPLVAWAAVRLGRPLRRLAEASEVIDLHASTPLPNDGPREVQVLADAIHAGRERLREQAQEMTRMLAAVAHDLRTPLTGLRLRAEFAPPAQAARMVADIERMNSMITQVLDYARGELEPPDLQLLDLVPMLEDSVHAARLRGVAIHADLPATLPWVADALLLRRALDNLIDNAARYAGALELHGQQHGDTLHLDVLDRGPGIPLVDRERLLQPFQRSEASRSRATGGAGLGLALAANAARQHGGQLQLLDREGGGLRARLLLRRAP
ncbi:HAMP domain-containing sensor histidine kinase [Stenotrophomonas sp. 24(2023)]|uniref:sensor histidine kinase n=1 Tax=Stenotrophomonas sp. 24(2023) TaxID=3068324 RepID=UPI0027DF9EFD|nr:HAMP domain-containing sensor histidine kinase [Stenotrophomonas sp. 24(2023)]WMJ71434.1 HAMP domain-containing sensor histidine kinase [Stenotrophomonas sp. 24(2023)]